MTHLAFFLLALLTFLINYNALSHMLSPAPILRRHCLQWAFLSLLSSTLLILGSLIIRGTN